MPCKCILCSLRDSPPKNGIEIDGDRYQPPPMRRRTRRHLPAEEGGKENYVISLELPFSPRFLASPQPQSVYRFSSLTIASFVPLIFLPLSLMSEDEEVKHGKR